MGEMGTGKVEGKGKKLADKKGKWQARNDNEGGEGEHDDDDKDPSYKDRHDLSALHIVQQAS